MYQLDEQEAVPEPLIMTISAHSPHASFHYIITAAITAAASGIEAIKEVLLDASNGSAAEVMLVK